MPAILLKYPTFQGFHHQNKWEIRVDLHKNEKKKPIFAFKLGQIGHLYR